MTLTYHIPEHATFTAGIALAEAAINNNQQLSEKIRTLVDGTPGPYTLIHHHAYLFERIRDVKIILNRLKENRAVITELAIKEDTLRPKKRLNGKPHSSSWASRAAR